MKIFSQTLAFAVTAALTWIITSGLRAQTPPRSSAPQPNVAITPDETTTITVEDDGGNPPIDQAQAVSPREQTGWLEMHPPDIFALDGQAVINSGVTMKLSPTTAKFIWHVRILDPTATKVVDHRLYDHQSFQANADGTHTSTFGDMMPLPPGKSRVQLRLYAVPAGYDPRLLLIEKNSQARMILQGFKDVVN